MHGHEAAVIASGGAVIVALIGVVYKNLRSSVRQNEKVCDDRADTEVKFKLDIIDRLARIETAMNGKVKE